jgi:N-acyl amino acid synthase of PEP-CTERM/exosortase system
VSANDATTSYFRACEIDDSPALMQQSYSLRYQVYCKERHFLPAEDYPDGLEMDAFDRYSVHVGVLDAWDELAATARVVSLTKAGAGFPLFRHCRIFADETELIEPDNNVVEISRLSMSRRYRRRPVDGVPERRDVRRQAFLTLLKGIYQATKRMDATHWLAATEKSLQRLVEQYGFPFRVIGPEADYGGPVAPYLMNLAEFDWVVLSKRIPALDDFLVGLEPQFHPRRDVARRLLRGPQSAGAHTDGRSRELAGSAR